MIKDKTEISNFIREEFEKIFNTKIEDDSKNLLGSNIKINAVDFLYLFDAIEKEFSVDTGRIITNISYKDFTIDCLATAILYQKNSEVAKLSC